MWNDEEEQDDQFKDDDKDISHMLLITVIVAFLIIIPLFITLIYEANKITEKHNTNISNMSISRETTKEEYEKQIKIIEEEIRVQLENG